RHRRVEVTRRFAIGQVAPAVGAVGREQRDIAFERLFEHIQAAVDLAMLLAFGEPRADRNRRIEAAEPGGGAAHAFADDALRRELQFDAAGGIELLEYDRAGAARKRADDPPDPAGREQRRKPPPPGPGIVCDDRQIARALLDDRLAQDVRQARAAEPGA